VGKSSVIILFDQGENMGEPELIQKTLTDCADNLERLRLILNDLGLAVCDHYPGISLAIGNYADALEEEEIFLRNY
jgi:hypothetical protein